MRVRRNRQKTGSEPNYWQSYSDMMAALLMIASLIPYYIGLWMFRNRIARTISFHIES